MRLDQWLVKHQKVRSRSQAEELIKRGEVLILSSEKNLWIKILKPSYEVNEAFDPKNIKIESVISEFVARSGYKLKKALEHVRFDVEGLNCLDVGQSTGGFSQVLLESNAKKVIGVDVGQNQISADLRKYQNLICFENLDIRKAGENEVFVKESPFEFVVVDVSFISLLNVLDPILNFIKPDGHVLALVKPQFELTKSDLDKKGLVKDPSKYKDVEAKIKNYITAMEGIMFLDFFKSSLEGKDGNVEFFVYLKKLK